MPTIPEYQVQTQDINTFQTRETGAHADAMEFDPLAGADKLAQGLDSVSDVAERQATKEDMVWAQKAFTGAQVQMLEQVKNYTDPDAFAKDYDTYTKSLMAGAPTGRASDFLVQHMDTFGPRLVRRVLFQQAKQQTDQTSADFTTSAANIAAIATGQAPGSPAAAPDGGPLPIQPKMGSTDLKLLNDQLDQAAVAAKGVVPSSVIAQTVADTRNKIAQGTIKAATLEDGPGAIAAQLEDDPGKLIPDGSMSKDDLTGVINSLRTQDSANQGVAISNAIKSRKNIVDMIERGNSPTTESMSAFADDYANVMGGKMGKKADEERVNVLEDFATSQKAYNFKQELMGLTPDQIRDKVIQLGQTEDENGLQYQKEQAIAGKVIAGMDNDARLKGTMAVTDFKIGLNKDDNNDAVQAKLDEFAKTYDPTTPEYAKAAAAANQLQREQAKTQGQQAKSDFTDFVAKAPGQTPEQVLSHLSDFSAKYGQDSPLFNKANGYATKLLNDLKTSPGDYALNDTNYRQSLAAANDNLGKAGNDPAAQSAAIAQLQHVWKTGISMQKMAGLEDTQTGVLPAVAAKEIAGNIQNATPQDAANILHTWQKYSGDMYPIVLRDLSRQGLSAQYQALSSYAGTPVENTAILALQQDKNNRTAINDEAPGGPGTGSVSTSIKNSVSAAMTDYRNAVGWNADGTKGANQIQSLVESVTRQNMATQGMDVKTAAQQAAQSLIHDYFDYGKVNGKTFMVTKQYVPDGDTDSVITGAKSLIPEIGKGEAFNPDIAAFYGKPATALDQGDRDEYQKAISSKGYWISSPDGKSMRLAVNIKDLAMLNMHVPDTNGSGIVNPPKLGGGPIDVPITAMQQGGKIQNSSILYNAWKRSTNYLAGEK